MQTGHAPGERLAYPSVGAVFALVQEPRIQGADPALRRADPAAGTVLRGGLPGPTYKPFATGGDPNAPRFEVEGRRRPRHHRRAAEEPRRELLGKTEHDGPCDGRQPASCRPLGGGQEAGLRADPGPGQGGVRPLEGETGAARPLRPPHVRPGLPGGAAAGGAGVPYVVINYPGGWDTHSNHFATMRRQCPQLDQGLAALLADLKDRGLLESTHRLVLRRVRPRTQGRLAAALERRPQPLRQRLHRAGRRRRIQGRARRRRLRREGRGGQGAARLPGGPARQHLSTWPASTPARQLPHPMGLEAHVLPAASEGVKSGRAADRDHVADGCHVR